MRESAYGTVDSTYCLMVLYSTSCRYGYLLLYNQNCTRLRHLGKQSDSCLSSRKQNHLLQSLVFRDRKRQEDTQTYRQNSRRADQQTGRPEERQTSRQAGSLVVSDETGRQICSQAETLTCSQARGPTCNQTYISRKKDV